jgi:hypothetical protein
METPRLHGVVARGDFQPVRIFVRPSQIGLGNAAHRLLCIESWPLGELLKATHLKGHIRSAETDHCADQKPTLA